MPDATTPESSVQPPPSRRGRRVQIGLAVALSPLAFVFGTYLAALSLPALLPGLRRARPFAVTLFFGVCVVFVLGLAGVNPVEGAVERKVVAELQEAFGGEVSYDSIRSDSAAGTISFKGLRMKLPQDGGEIKARNLTVQTGTGYILPTASYKLQADGLELTMDPSAPRVREFIDKPPRTTKPIEAEITDSSFRFKGKLTPDGPEVDADFKIERLKIVAHNNLVDLTVALTGLDLVAFGARHELEISGGLQYRKAEDGVTVRPMLNLREGTHLLASIQGSLTPDGTGSIVATIDHASAAELWGAYGMPGTLTGTGRARISATGPLNDLRIEASGEVYAVSAYHPLLMGLDAAKALRVGMIRFDAAASLGNLREFSLGRLDVDGAGATLAQESALRADGNFVLKVEQAEQGMQANLEITVTEGQVRRAITWNPLSTASLSDLKPGLLRVGDFLPDMRVQYVVEVEHLDVRAEPLIGVARGRLHGTAEARRGQPLSLTVGGQLVLHEGRFEFLGASGEADVRLEYHEARPPAAALLRGELRGQVGDAPLTASLSGMLIRPVLTFTGMTMTPDELGSRIYRGGSFTATQRRRICLELCGPSAAVEGNPFMARSTGKVRFHFR